MKKLFPWLPFLVLTAIFMVASFYGGTVLGYHSPAISFELNRIGGMGAVLKGPVNYVTFGAVGSPVNLFYPWLIYGLSYPIGFALTSFIYGYMAIFAIVTFATFELAYLAVKKITGNVSQAFLFSVIWTFSAYRTFDVVRNSVGEALVFAFIPLAFLGIYQLINKRGKYWWVLALGLTLITYTYATISLMVLLYGLLILVVFRNQIPDIRATSLGFLKGLGLTILATAFYWQPLAAELFIPFRGARHFSIPISSLNPQTMLWNSLTGNAAGYGFGLVLLVLIIWAYVNWRKLSFNYRSLLIIGTVSLVLATGIFPWGALNADFRRGLTIPGILMVMATLFIGFVGSYVVVSYGKQWLNCLGIVLAILAFIVPMMKVQLNTPQSDRVTFTNETNLVGFYNVDDYFPTASKGDLKSIVKNIFIVNGDHKTINRDSFGNRVKFETPKGTINTPILYVNGIRVTINGKPVPTHISKRGTVEFKSTVNNGKAVVTSKYTTWNKIAAVISIIGWLTLLSVMLYDWENDR